MGCLEDIILKTKKIIVVLLIVICVLITCLALTGCNSWSKTKIAIITDIHVLAEAQIGDELTESFQAKSASGQKMLHLSEAIFRSALDQVAQSDATTMLLPGDLTDDGGRISHEMVAAELAKLEEKGIDVYVIPGNHDILNKSKIYDTDEGTETPNVSLEDFREIYKDFGYDETLSTYEGTLSYTANLGKKYRLIAIDVCTYTLNDSGGIENRNAPNLTEGLINWTTEQVAQAKEDGRLPLGMMHFPLMEHRGDFIETIKISPNSKVNQSQEFAAALSEAGLNYIFTGHVHSQDISVYEDEHGIVYDIETGCLADYPSPIRYWKADKEDINITTEFLQGIKQEYIPAYAQEDSYSLINDYRNFASNYSDGAMLAKFKSKLSADTIASLLDSVGLDDPEGLAEVLKSIIIDPLLDQFLNMEIYGKRDSLQSIAAKYGVTLPETDYPTIMSVLMSFVKANTAGDENASVDSDAYQILKYAVYSIFNELGPFYNLAQNIVGMLPDVNLRIAAQSLFQTDELDLVALDIEDILVPLVADYLDISPTADIYEVLEALSNMHFEEMLFGIELQNYFDKDNGTIRLGALLDEFLFDIAKDNLTVDTPPADNNIRINRETLEATPLS